MPATQRKCTHEGLTLDVDRHHIGSVTATTHQEKGIITLESNPSRGTVLPAPHGKISNYMNIVYVLFLFLFYLLFSMSGAPLQVFKIIWCPVCFVNHPLTFEAVSCFVCDRGRMAVIRHRMIGLVIFKLSKRGTLLRLMLINGFWPFYLGSILYKFL